MMKQLTNLAIASVILAAGTANSWAQSVMYTTSTPISSQTTDWSSPLAFQQFDPTLGTLNSVTLNYTSTLSTSVTILNNSDSISTGHDQTDVAITVEDAGINLGPDPQLDPISIKFDFSLDPGQQVTSPTEGTLGDSGNSGNLVYTSQNILNEFTGNGSITLTASTYTESDLTSSAGNTSASQTTQDGLTGTVTYNYTPAPIPEPSTFGLVAFGFAALPYLRRKRK